MPMLWRPTVDWRRRQWFLHLDECLQHQQAGISKALASAPINGWSPKHGHGPNWPPSLVVLLESTVHVLVGSCVTAMRVRDLAAAPVRKAPVAELVSIANSVVKNVVVSFAK